jgi:hypothetical protein
VAEALPVPVLDGPHWRVNFQPASYDKSRVTSLQECLDILQKNRVSLRGWDFPHIGRGTQLIYGPTWIANWSDAWGHLEYWRFYQSTQFLYLGSVREVTQKDWNARIRKAMRFHADDNVDIDAVPGFVSLTEVIYNTTEIFEFAGRLAQAGVYTEQTVISVHLKRVKGFMLAADENRGWTSDYVTSQDELRYEVNLTPQDLVAGAADHAFRCTIWLFERFGWLKPNVDVIKSDQQKLLTRRL